MIDMTTSEKLAESATLTLLMRLLTPMLLSVAGFFLWTYISAIRTDASAAVNAAAALQARVSVLESSHASDRLESMKFHDQVLRQLAETNRALGEQGKQLSALAATIEGLRERIGGR